MYAGLFLHQPALRMLGRGLGSLGDYIDAFDDHAVFLDEYLEYTSLFAAVFAGEHLYGVAFLICCLLIVLFVFGGTRRG